MSLVDEITRNKNRFFNAQGWIHRYLEQASDTKPTASTFRNMDISICPETSAKIVPFKSAVHFYKEYEISFGYDRSNDPTLKAGDKTFRRALERFTSTQKLRFSRCRGSMAKCDICQNSTVVLSSQAKLRQEHRDMIYEFVRIHHRQQEAERLFSELQRLNAFKDTDENGDPICAFFLVDAMGQWTTESPKNGTKGATGKEWMTCPKFDTRLIAVEVVCGPIVSMFHYYHDATIGHGANTLIEVVRRMFEDLARLLANKGLKFPKLIKLQFDNSGEQKVVRAVIYLVHTIINLQLSIISEQVHVHVSQCVDRNASALPS
jgi:hypothetical protein